jgi:hypothetical protein
MGDNVGGDPKRSRHPARPPPEARPHSLRTLRRACRSHPGTTAAAHGPARASTPRRSRCPRIRRTTGGPVTNPSESTQGLPGRSGWGFIVWQDYRDPEPAVCAQHLNWQGTPQWLTGGVDMQRVGHHPSSGCSQRRTEPRAHRRQHHSQQPGARRQHLRGLLRCVDRRTELGSSVGVGNPAGSDDGRTWRRVSRVD